MQSIVTSRQERRGLYFATPIKLLAEASRGRESINLLGLSSTAGIIASDSTFFDKVLTPGYFIPRAKIGIRNGGREVGGELQRYKGIILDIASHNIPFTTPQNNKIKIGR